jgi:hypothetical protein
MGMKIVDWYNRVYPLETRMKTTYIINKLLVLLIGGYIAFYPPFTWVGTISSAIMMVAALIAVWAIAVENYDAEYVALWFVNCGLGSYVGFQLINLAAGESNVARVGVALMALTLMIGRGQHIGQLRRSLMDMERLLNKR